MINKTTIINTMNDTHMSTESESEEEILIYAEIKNNVNINKYRNIHVLGIETKYPVIQADDSFFTGKYGHSLGTYMFFEEDPSPKSADPLFDKLPERNLKYVSKTNKLLEVDVAYVIPKECSGENEELKIETQQQRDEVQDVTFSTIEEAISKFGTVFAPKPESTIEEAISKLGTVFAPKPESTENSVINTHSVEENST